MSKKAEDKKLHVGDLRNKVDNIFVLINLAGKRIRELVSGSPKLIQTESDDPMYIALEEITQGKITVGKSKNVSTDKQETSGKKEK